MSLATMSISVSSETVRIELHVSTAAGLVVVVAAIAAMVFLFFVRRAVAREAASAVAAERTRVARELHDTLAQGLTGIRLYVEAALANVENPVRTTDTLEAVRQLTRSTFVDMKRVLLDLRPRELSGSDFTSALHEMVRTMTQGLPVAARVRAEGTARPLPSQEVEHQLFRIAQEAVTNSLRHARARTLDIIVVYGDACVDLTISDDGLGSGAFTLAELTAGAPNGGTHGMQERARQIGATFVISRNGSQGLAIHVRVPTGHRLPATGE